jgi:hypothetical protein
VGYKAGYSKVTGLNSTYIGGLAGANTTGSNNTFLGQASGQLVTTGAKNTILGPYNGNQGGLDIRTASNYIVLSDGDGVIGAYWTGGQWAFKPVNTGTSQVITWAATGGTAQYYIVNSTNVGSITCSTTATAYVTSSDYRLKHSIAPMTGALAKVAALKPVTYKWNADGSDGEGFIAHELAEVCPHAVIGEKDAADEDGKPKYQGIDTSFLVATLTAAIQEQQAMIETLTARVAQLESK